MTAMYGMLAVGRSPRWLGPTLVAGGLAALAGVLAVGLLWSHRYGQSPGKRFYGICVRRLDGERVSLARIVLLRNVVPVAIGRLPIAGPFFALFDYAAAARRNRRCLHDHLADTQVVIAPDESAEPPVPWVISAGATALATIIVIAASILSAFEIEGPSSEPSLLNGDRVAAIVPLPIAGARLERGALVVARSPHAKGVSIIKRIVGVAGDRVAVINGEIVVNGKALEMRDDGRCTLGVGKETPQCHSYTVKLGERAFHVSYARTPMDSTETLVPKGAVYLLGDHLDSSNDSRNPAIGAVDVDLIQGVVLSLYWSSVPGEVRWDRFPMPAR